MTTASSTPSKYHSGSFTSRGLSYYAGMLAPPLRPLHSYISHLTRRAEPAAFELGCGEAHALTELQAKWPRVSCVCLNSATWGRQAGRLSGGVSNAVANPEALLHGMAQHFHINLTRKTSQPRLPHIDYGDYRLRGLPYANRSFDFVFSSNALNEGKMHDPRSDLAPILSDTVRVLRPAGVALLHLLSCTDKELAQLRCERLRTVAIPSPRRHDRPERFAVTTMPLACAPC